MLVPCGDGFDGKLIDQYFGVQNLPDTIAVSAIWFKSV